MLRVQHLITSLLTDPHWWLELVCRAAVALLMRTRCAWGSGCSRWLWTTGTTGHLSPRAMAHHPHHPAQSTRSLKTSAGLCRRPPSAARPTSWCARAPLSRRRHANTVAPRRGVGRRVGSTCMGIDHGWVSPQLLGESRGRSFNSMEDGVPTLQVRGWPLSLFPAQPPSDCMCARALGVLCSFGAPDVIGAAGCDTVC